MLGKNKLRVKILEDKDIIYLDGGFFGSSYNSKKFTFLNKNNGLIYLKKEGNFYRQIDEDNPFVYELDNSVSELRDLKEVKWNDIYSSSNDNGSEKVYQYVINKLSKFKKPKDNYLYEFKSSISFATTIYINGSEANFHLDEYLYVPKRIEDEGLDYVEILVAKDEVFLKFTRFLSDGSYSVIYDNDFNVVMEGENSSSNMWDRLENYKKDDSKEMIKQWGFIRETSEIAKRAGIDKATGIPRTGLDEYLSVIFPDTDDWVHDKTTGLVKEDGKKSLSRPDYRSEQLKLIVEFDADYRIIKSRVIYKEI